MKINRNRVLIAGAVAVCLLAIVSASETGRAALSRVFSSAELKSTNVIATTQSGQDLEQRVRDRHGWNAEIRNSVLSGQITYYNREGEVKDQATFTLYRIYPDRMRAVLHRGTSIQTIGFNRDREWRDEARNLSDVEARDIRAWLRFWPERLFQSRAGGAAYKEVGQRIEEFRQATPWQGSERLETPLVLDQIEIEDTIGAAPDGQRAGDRRSIYYYIDRESLLIRSTRWLEPDDPRVRADDASASKMDSRIDFENWFQQGGVMWPMHITRWLGGKVDYRIQVNEVLVNQTLADTLFQNQER
jgi:hypothetical protein